VPREGVVPGVWHSLVVHRTKRGEGRINRISYELCVLQGLREKLRCKEVWVEGADRYRNPDEDLPADFTQQREEYYTALNQPLDVEALCLSDLTSKRRLPYSCITRQRRVILCRVDHLLAAAPRVAYLLSITLIWLKT
jgi:hypothetical protein